MPVEILFKPKPAYTLEAEELHLEGEVLLNVVFLASGGMRFVRIVHGLGHGLDEAAAEAAEHIRFRPASCGGVPKDVNATVHVSFRLTGRQPRPS
jgi:TonB family protein